jgi:hypothetical protein
MVISVKPFGHFHACNITLFVRLLFIKAPDRELILFMKAK